jgi:hypothetical protein
MRWRRAWRGEALASSQLPQFNHQSRFRKLNACCKIETTTVFPSDGEKFYPIDRRNEQPNGRGTASCFNSVETLIVTSL